MKLSCFTSVGRVAASALVLFISFLVRHLPGSFADDALKKNGLRQEWERKSRSINCCHSICSLLGLWRSRLPWLVPHVLVFFFKNFFLFFQSSQMTLFADHFTALWQIQSLGEIAFLNSIIFLTACCDPFKMKPYTKVWIWILMYFSFPFFFFFSSFTFQTGAFGMLQYLWFLEPSFRDGNEKSKITIKKYNIKSKTCIKNVCGKKKTTVIRVNVLNESKLKLHCIMHQNGLWVVRHYVSHTEIKRNLCTKLCSYLYQIVNCTS